MDAVDMVKPGQKKREQFMYLPKNWKAQVSVLVWIDTKNSPWRDTLLSLYNQTYYLFEIILVVKDKDWQEEKWMTSLFPEPNRIKIFYQNDFLKKELFHLQEWNARTSDYTLLMKAGDLVEKTYLETAFISLSFQKKKWIYSDVITYGAIEKKEKETFDWEHIINQNQNLWGAVISNILLTEWMQAEGDISLGAFLYAQKAYPIHVSYYGYWRYYEEEPVIESVLDTMETDMTQVVQFPRNMYQGEILETTLHSIPVCKRKKDHKIPILMIVPWMIMGGADKFNFDLLRLLDKDRFSVTLITTHPTAYIWRPLFEQLEIEIFDLSTFIDHKYWCLFLEYIIETRNIQLIFNTNSTFGYVSIPYLKQKYPSLPVLDYIHMEEWYNRFGGYSRDNHIVHTLLDKTLFCNQRSERILHDYFKVPKEQIDTVYIGVDTKVYNPTLYDKDRILKEYNVPSNRFIIGYICRISTVKRPFLLLEILDKVKDKIPHVLFLIAGDGPLLEEMKKRVATKNLSSYIQFLGQMESAITYKFYKMCDITINCSVKEGVALTSYESLAMGVPVISSDVGGQSELISKDVGIIVPLLQQEDSLYETSHSEEEVLLYVDAIMKIKENLSDYQKHTRERIVKSFTLENMIEKMEKNFLESVHHPREEAIWNAKKLKYNSNLAKEYLHYYFLSDLPHFQSLCNAYYKQFYEPPFVPLTEEEIAAMKKNPIVFKMEQTAIRFHIYHEFMAMEKMFTSLFQYIASFFISLWKIFSGFFITLYQIVFSLGKLLFLFMQRLFHILCKIIKRK